MTDNIQINIFLENNELFNLLPEGFVASGIDDADVVVSSNINPQFLSSAFKIYVCSKKPKAFESSIENFYDGWVLQNDITALEAIVKENVKPSISLKKQDKLLAKVSVYNEIAAGNCTLIKEQLSHNVAAIGNLFQEQVRVMRENHKEIKETRQILQQARDIEDISAKVSLLDKALLTTDSILVRTDGVINVLYGFIGVLQFEDRLSQMLTGIQRVLQDCVTDMQNFGVQVTAEANDLLRQEIVKFYTVQEQRDFAFGNSVQPKYYEAPVEDSSTAPDSEDDDMMVFF